MIGAGSDNNVKINDENKLTYQIQNEICFCMLHMLALILLLSPYEERRCPCPATGGVLTIETNMAVPLFIVSQGVVKGALGTLQVAGGERWWCSASISRYSSLEGEAIKSNNFHIFEVFFVCDFVSVVTAGRGVS